MELRALKSFVTVCRCGQITKAAHELGYAQSTLTAQIQQLEQDLQVQLFERMGRQLNLTPPGQTLYHYARRILDLSQEARQALELNQEPSGPLTIASAESACQLYLPRWLEKFCHQYPKVEINIRIGSCSEFRDWLRNRSVDLAFSLEEVNTNPDYKNLPLALEEVVFLASPQHPLTQKTSLELKDLENQTFILSEKGCSFRRLLEAELLKAHIELKTIIEINSLEASKQLAMTSLGLTLQSRNAAKKELQQGNLIALPWNGPSFPIMLQLIYHKDQWISPAMQAFIEVVKSTPLPSL